VRPVTAGPTRAFVVTAVDSDSLARHETRVVVEAPGLDAEGALTLVKRRLNREDPTWFTPIVLDFIQWQVEPIHYFTQSTVWPERQGDRK
jgi:hypothetical protein